MLPQLLDIFSPPFCLYCKEESPQLVCTHCLQKIEKVHNEPSGIISYGRYEGILKELIHSFKYENKFALAAIFANLLKDLIPSDIDMMIPIPLHIQKIRERKYNQSILLAKALSKLTTISFYVNVLQKTFSTPSQIELSKEKRLSNVQNSFAVKNTHKILRKHLLLVDDVYTTGATMKEATKVLQAAGAKKISVLTIASSL